MVPATRFTIPPKQNTENRKSDEAPEIAARREARGADTGLRILSVAEVAAMVGVHRATLHRWQRKGILPPRRRVGAGRVRFLSTEIEGWLRNLKPALGAKETALTVP